MVLQSLCSAVAAASALIIHTYGWTGADGIGRFAAAEY